MEENEKMEMETADVTQQNIDKIAELFPNCVTEIEDKERSAHDHKIYKKGINFDRLRQMLSNDIVEGREAYDFTWIGKKASILEANKPIRKTLRPCINESLNWDTTENLYIEGDNLEVLKLLRESYLNKVKMIYIDPPYNRGEDLIYKDDYHQTKEEYDEECEVCDEDGNRLFKNTDSNGRFHSDWCSMIYPRLLLARDLLHEDGVIFISIDYHEVANLRKICDEVFGEKNFRNAIIIRRGVKNLQAQFDFIDKLNNGYEYILMYSNKTDVRLNKIYREDNTKEDGTIETVTGGWNNHWRGTDRPTMRYDIFGITPQKGQWRWARERSYNAITNYKNMLQELGKNNPTQEEIDKWYLDKIQKNGFNKIDLLRLSRTGKPEHYIAPTNKKLLSDLWEDIKPNGNTYTTQLFNSKVFDNPKSVDLLKRLLELLPQNGDIILDFFSGSATTAHAVMQLNAEDGRNRKFIMVQLPEIIDSQKSTLKESKEVTQNAIAFLDSIGAPHNICEIGKERIRRAGAKIKEEHPEVSENLDVGFRVFKVDESNMKDVYFSAQEYNQEMLSELESNIKPDRTDLDLLFGCLLEAGVPLSMPYKSEKIDGYTVHTYGDGDQIPLIACFEENIPDSVIDTIAKRHPLRVVLRDSCFKDSAAKINIFERFKTFSPNTKVRVI